MVPPLWVPVRRDGAAGERPRQRAPQRRSCLPRGGNRRSEFAPDAVTLSTLPPELVLPGRHAFLSARWAPAPRSHTRSLKGAAVSRTRLLSSAVLSARSLRQLWVVGRPV